MTKKCTNHHAFSFNLRYIVIIAYFLQIYDISHTICRKYGYNIFTTYRKRRKAVNTKQAIAKRILALCEQRHIAVNELANISGVAPSTVYSILNEKSQNPGAVTIKKLCDGLNITLGEFFSTPEFDALEQEIK